MNAEILPKVKKPVTEFNIHVDGHVIGDVETCGDDRWRASLHLIDRRLVGSQIIFGYGDTKEAAIADALRDGHEQMAAFAERLAELEAKLGVEVAA